MFYNYCVGYKHRTTVEDRFWAKVEKTDGCWLWTASTINGFGQFRANGHGLAVQYSWELHFGVLPKGQRIKQTCENRACVRPDHLTAGAEGRFWMKVDKDGPIPAHNPMLGQCWVWTGSVKGNTKGHGYGDFVGDDGRQAAVHRFSYELANGPITEGMDIDHRCRNKLCVRPTHLREATRKQNLENQGVSSRSKTGIRGVYLAGFDVLEEVQWYGVLVNHHGEKYCGGFFTDLALAEIAAKEVRNGLFTHNDDDRPSELTPDLPTDG